MSFAMAEDILLSISDLAIEFPTVHGTARAVDGVSFAIRPGTTVGLVGESGSGKSLTALSVLRLIQPPGRIASGRIDYRGSDLLGMSEPALRKIRGNHIAMIFQEPMTSLNPVLTVGEQVAEALRLHKGQSHGAAKAATLEVFQLVGIPSPEERYTSYPHQLSGGMRQRVMIAMALSCRPELLIADEPTTALDVTIQAQILALLSRLGRELSMAVLLITHDLGVVAEICDEVLVMYGGHIVEQGHTRAVLASPRHPYTAGLLRAIPPFSPMGSELAARSRLAEIPGSVPTLGRFPHGCKFQDRCPGVADRCRQEAPTLAAADRRSVRCHFPLAESP